MKSASILSRASRYILIGLATLTQSSCYQERSQRKVDQAHASETINSPVKVVPYIEQIDLTQENYHTIKSHSPNHNKANRSSVDLVVLHTTEGTGTSALNTFQNPNNKVSAHYLIMEDGVIYALVDEKDIAWHCKNHNQNSIGIELAGYHNRNLKPEQIKSAQLLIKTILSKYNLERDHIKAHSELDPSRRKDPGKANLERILQGI